MTFTLDVAWLLTVVLVAVRVGAAIALTPVLGVSALPNQLRVLVVVGLSATLVAALQLPIDAANATLSHFVAAVISEAAIGMALAFGLLTAFASFSFAGRIVDMQLGFGVASLIDPATHTQQPLLGYFLNLLAVVLFFAIDGHHALIRGLAYSLSVLPPGATLPQWELGQFVTQFGSMFIYAAVIAMPVVFVVLLIDVVLAVIARTMPQMNVFIVGLPLKILVGLMVLAFSLSYLTPAFKRVFEDLFTYWQGLLG